MKSGTTNPTTHSIPVSYRMLWWVSFLTIEAALLMIYLRITQIGPSVQSILAHKRNEMALIVQIAVLRQCLRAICIFYCISQIVIAWQLLSLDYEIFLKRRRFFQNASFLLTLTGGILQYLSLTDLYTNLFMAACLLFQGMQTFLTLKRKSLRLLFSVGLTAYTFCIFSNFVYGYTYCRQEEPAAIHDGVSTTAVSNKDILHQIWDMSTEDEFYHAAFYEQKQGMNYGLIPIPGMEYADSVTKAFPAEQELRDPSSTPKFFERDTCTSMTPQGITLSDSYIFISAYCYTRRHNSVIFVIDRKDGTFVKQIVLPEKTHAGGLAYDPNYGTLWLTTKMKQKTDHGFETVSALACLTDENIEDYHFERTGQPIEYRNICPTQFRSNSCLTYKDGYIYIGYWMKSKMAMSIAGKFKVRKSGVSVKDRASEIFHIPGQVQGIALNEDQIYFTISYGMKKSTILMYHNDEEADTHVFSAASPERSVNLPQMLEEICLYDGMLYTLFESSAFAYRYTAPVCMDHIVKIRIAGLRKP